MKVSSFLRVSLSLAVFVLSIAAANAAPAYGFINLTIYGYLLNPVSVATTAYCSGSVSLTTSSTLPLYFRSGSSYKSTTVNVPANTQSFSCQITIPYYFNNPPAGAGIDVGYGVYSSVGNSASVSDTPATLTPIPTGYVTTSVSAVAML